MVFLDRVHPDPQAIIRALPEHVLPPVTKNRTPIVLSEDDANACLHLWNEAARAAEDPQVSSDYAAYNPWAVLIPVVLDFFGSHAKLHDHKIAESLDIQRRYVGDVRATATGYAMRVDRFVRHACASLPPDSAVDTVRHFGRQAYSSATLYLQTSEWTAPMWQAFWRTVPDLAIRRDLSQETKQAILEDLVREVESQHAGALGHEEASPTYRLLLQLSDSNTPLSDTLARLMLICFEREFSARGTAWLVPAQCALYGWAFLHPLLSQHQRIFESSLQKGYSSMMIQSCAGTPTQEGRLMRCAEIMEYFTRNNIPVVQIEAALHEVMLSPATGGIRPSHPIVRRILSENHPAWRFLRERTVRWLGENRQGTTEGASPDNRDTEKRPHR